MTKNEAIKNLTRLRDELARKTGVEGYKILQYRTIELIASQMPDSLGALLDIKGIGQKKLDQFGRLILEAINDGLGNSGTTDNEKDSHQESQIKGDDEALTVSEFLDQVNEALSETLSDVYVVGEIAEFNEHPSGVYLTLKDQEDESILNCYLPPGVYRELGVNLDAGMLVKAAGRPNVWKPKGRFSLTIASLELVGEGALRKAYELLKKKLEAEGLFARKRDLPEFISNIGVITSRTGAVISDFRHNLLPLGLSVSLYDARVEGARAVNEVRQGIRWFNDNRPDLDVLVIIRGGGSLEDLQAFNNELVAREIFASRIPTIAGIGHDRDVPIATLVAEAAESTPTAVAGLVNQSWERLTAGLPQLAQTLVYEADSIAKDRRQKLRNLTQQLAYAGQNLVNSAVDLVNRFRQSGQQFSDRLSGLENKLTAYQKILESANPERPLRLGYSIVRNRRGQVVRSAGDVKLGEEIETKLAAGGLRSKINKIIK